LNLTPGVSSRAGVFFFCGEVDDAKTETAARSTVLLVRGFLDERARSWGGSDLPEIASETPAAKRPDGVFARTSDGKRIGALVSRPPAKSLPLGLRDEVSEEAAEEERKKRRNYTHVHCTIGTPSNIMQSATLP
jgi:hypothetical protein